MYRRAMGGNRIAKHDDQRTVDRKKVLAPIELRAACGVQPLNRDTVAHDFTPVNFGVVSVTPSARSSSVVAPMVSTMRPPAGTDNTYSCASWS